MENALECFQVIIIIIMIIISSSIIIITILCCFSLCYHKEPRRILSFFNPKKSGSKNFPRYASCANLRSVIQPYNRVEVSDHKKYPIKVTLTLLS